MKHKKLIFINLALIFLVFGGIWVFKKYNFNHQRQIGEKLDSLNGVVVYYNGGVNNVEARNLTEDGYNLGLKYQCVEFVKRYYFQHYHHKMPDSFGHAKDFFDTTLEDGSYNKKRDLIQFSNPSETKPASGDLLVFRGTIANRFGHVAIISMVSDNKIEIIQQNPGPYGKSRVTFDLNNIDGKWKIENNQLLGWLRTKNQ